MSAPVLTVENVGKRYHLYARPQDRLKQSLFGRFGKSFAAEFWALRDVNFEIQRGETVGIIGRNGSGKSTLLEIIAGTLTPSTGAVRAVGRVTALLELGSGFSPEFTGRENVYLNGAIWGFSHKEIARRFDNIAAFADIGPFMDQPLKLYSSGMLVRLAFSVQAMLDPDILIVDEALAVGDAAFQLKCINRMKSLIQRGVAIILVSHDVQSVRSLCQRAIWLADGTVRSIGSSAEVTARYLQFLFADPRALTPASEPDASTAPPTLNTRTDLVRWGTGDIVVESVALREKNSAPGRVLRHGDPIQIEFEIRARRDVDCLDGGMGFAFRNLQGLDVITATTFDSAYRLPPLRAGQARRVTFELENILAPGDYALVLAVFDRSVMPFRYFDYVENALMFNVIADRPIYSLVLPTVTHQVDTIPNLEKA